MNDRRPVLAGIDGCRGGWVAATRRVPGGPVEIAVHRGFADLLAALDDRAQVAVDMPIGLPERIEGPGRVAEIAVRRFLGPRQSSVFSIPGRAAVESRPAMFHDELHRRESHAAASALARTLSTPSRGVSIQGYMLFDKILEIDAVLGAAPELCERVVESHPEFAFAVLNAMMAMETPKKIRNRANPAGIAERQALLEANGIAPEIFEKPRPAGVGADDLVDSLAMLLVAERRAAGTARPYPDPPGRDAKGLPIAIWA